MKKIKYYGYAGVAGLGVTDNYKEVKYYHEKYLNRGFKVKSFPIFEKAADYAVSEYNRMNSGDVLSVYYDRLVLDQPRFRKEIIKENQERESFPLVWRR